MDPSRARDYWVDRNMGRSEQAKLQNMIRGTCWSRNGTTGDGGHRRKRAEEGGAKSKVQREVSRKMSWKKRRQVHPTSSQGINCVLAIVIIASDQLCPPQRQL
jgi:hypothetical protein